MKGWDEEKVVSVSGLSGHFGRSFESETGMDWSDKQERRALLAQLVAEARATQRLDQKALGGYASKAEKPGDLQASLESLLTVLGQETDEAPDEVEGPRIRNGTANDGVILSRGVQLGNWADREQALELVEQAQKLAGAKVTAVPGDEACGDTQTRTGFGGLAVDLDPS